MTSSTPPDSAEQVFGRESEYLINTYPRLPLVVDRGQGVYLWDTDGRRYLDLMSGLGVSALGHAHPRLVAALTSQASQVLHLSNLYSHRCQGELAEKLCHLSGMSAAFFSTGGAEAVEGALKLARSWAQQNFLQGQSQSKTGFVALEQSYHGRSFGALSVTGQPRYRESFGPALTGVRFARRNDVASLDAVMDESICAIIVEPIMGEGGVHDCSDGFLREARRLADQHHALLIFDEIQCGLGRTGSWFAFEKSGVRPDVLVIGKPLGGGLPLSAFLVAPGKNLRRTLTAGQHGSTLGGSPIACRLALEFLAIVEEEALLEQIRDTGVHLSKGLTRLLADSTVATQSRGTGLLQALELSMPVRPIVEQGLAKGLLLNSVQGNILRFLPPYLLEKSHVDEAMEQLDSLLAAVEPQTSAGEITAHVPCPPRDLPSNDALSSAPAIVS
jgi:predicted acetylornithine/succinylornithine family transaminase